MTAHLPIDALRKARAEHRALAAFNVYNLEQARAVCDAATVEGEPVILQAGSSAFSYAGREPLAALALACARESSADVGVHLDHSRDLEEVKHCLKLGYSSVMFDGSALPLEENIRLTREAVAEAHARGAWVEAELAGIAGDEDSSQEVQADGLTDPDTAAAFVSATGVDALAVAIGNVHGIPAKPVQLDLDLLAAISRRIDVPLVLHGASGLPDDQLISAVALGVAKINVNTELRRALRDGLAEASHHRDDLPSLLGPAQRAVRAVARERIRLFARTHTR
ncbi:class II fructose-bisphosphate aldolase [Conexibacter stalactiti]|uniref:Class II fructose-bisphosphate aldolase n=1 Tax=Conexibacter stalactiti TaxID=1940611 RepID=A0ABU4HIC5_9ACTN|nr:class II fructose-bisphosphate aldolase [Conexibacter stalactiti]MDW5593068.1 class II fructose-bisphosphate aldolase [Conexibacter stalactiti]MEC5033709.1 class II fructose-bisphosphate aldolase [Conexibacter stalactiti]